MNQTRQLIINAIGQDVRAHVLTHSTEEVFHRDGYRELVGITDVQHKRFFSVVDAQDYADTIGAEFLNPVTEDYPAAPVQLELFHV